MKTCVRSAVLLALLATVSAALAASDTPTSPVPALAKAKTIQVTAKFQGRNTTGDLLPESKLEIKVERPGKIWIADLPFPGPNQTPGMVAPASVYVTDGKQQYEYRNPENQFIKTVIATPGQGLHTRFGLPSKSTLNLLLSPAPFSAFQPAGEETVKGTPMLAYTLQYGGASGAQADSGQPAIEQRLLVDKKTHLPFRLSMSVIQGDKAAEIQHVEYSQWTLDKPIDPQVFAWTPPANATEYPSPEKSGQ